MKDFKFKKPCEEGFTLVELLITTTIMAGLVAIAVPQYSKYKVEGQITEVKANLGTVARAQEIYKFSNGSYATDTATLKIKLNSSQSSYKYENGSGTEGGFANAPSAFKIIAVSKGNKTKRCDSVAKNANSSSDTWCVDNLGFLDNKQTSSNSDASKGCTNDEVVDTTSTPCD